jgi:hypothetical protein
MNIFVLHEDPLTAAYMHCDKHVPKMILETAQMLCTAASIISNEQQPYKACYVNHPCNIWVRESRENFRWAFLLGTMLCNEYTRRFLKIHKTADVIKQMRDVFHRLRFEKDELTPFALCMPDIYKNPLDPIGSYRNFYNGEKHFAKWQRGTPQPEWSTHEKV